MSRKEALRKILLLSAFIAIAIMTVLSLFIEVHISLLLILFLLTGAGFLGTPRTNIILKIIFSIQVVFLAIIIVLTIRSIGS